jgi:hypothetical protein
MINPTSSEARDLIALAERMGIATEVAVRAVLTHLTDRDRSEDVIDSRPSVRRMKPRPERRHVVRKRGRARSDRRAHGQIARLYLV